MQQPGNGPETDTVEESVMEHFAEQFSHSHDKALQATIDQEKNLIDKGYVPERVQTSQGTHTTWHKGGNFEWPMAAVLIAILAFVVALIWGSPW